MLLSTVPYVPLLDGFEEGIQENQGPAASVSYDVAWEDRYTFANEVMGSSSAVSAANWSVVPPAAYPPSPNMRAAGVSIKGEGDVTLDPNTQIPVYDRATVTVQYRVGTVAYNGREQDPQFLNSLATDPAEQDALAWWDQEIDYSVEWYSLPGQYAKWHSSGVRLDVPIRKRVAIQTMTLTYLRLPFLPLAIVQGYVGRVNLNTFLGCDPGTVMFLGAKTNRQRDTTGLITQRTSLSFKWREKSWQFEPKPDGGWGRVVESDGADRYDTKDFRRLLKLLPAL